MDSRVSDRAGYDVEIGCMSAEDKKDRHSKKAESTDVCCIPYSRALLYG